MCSLIIVILAFGGTTTSGFVVTSPLSTKRALVQQQTTHQRGLLFQDVRVSRIICHSVPVIDSSSLMVSAESWRQYVPLIVSCGIIIDILLGSPLANKILAPMRPEGEEDVEDKKKTDRENNPARSNARIDAELIAKQALDKANNTLELRNFLEERKTDYDRMEEMKKELDASMQDLDEDMEARQKSIDERKK